MSTKKIAHIFDFLISLFEIKPQFSREIIPQNDLKKNFFLLYLTQMWKHVLFYGISVGLLFCFVCFLPQILKLFIENFVTKVNFSFASVSLILFCSLFIFSILFNHRIFLRFKNDTEFFLQRYQISCRVFIPHYVNMQHQTFKYDAPLLFVHYALRLLPLIIINIFLGFMTPFGSLACSLVSSALIFAVAYLKNKNNHYFSKIKEQSQKQKEFITNVEQSFDMIKSLSFFQYFQNNFSKFTRDFSALYKSIMFNYNSLSSIKFFGIFLVFG